MNPKHHILVKKVQLKLACFFYFFFLNYDLDNKLRKTDEDIFSVRVETGVRDRPAWTARGWPEDREVGRSVCTSLAPEPEGAMELECRARLQGDGRGETDFADSFFKQVTYGCTHTDKRACLTTYLSMECG